MRKRSFIKIIILLLLLSLAGLSYALPPPCEFYPNSGYQGETLTLDLYLHCGVMPPYYNELPVIIFDVPGIEVLEIDGDFSDQCSVKVKIEPDVPPGIYSPYVIFRDEIILTPQEATGYYLTLTVLESSPQFSLYPESPQRRGTFGIYLVKGLNTNFQRGATLVLSNSPGIFSVFQFVFSPTDLLTVLRVEGDVEPGDYDITVISGDAEVTEEGILTVTD